MWISGDISPWFSIGDISHGNLYTVFMKTYIRNKINRMAVPAEATESVIESGIPINNRGPGRPVVTGDRLQKLAEKMVLGDSVLLPNSNQARCLRLALERIFKAGKGRRHGDGWRVWYVGRHTCSPCRANSGKAGPEHAFPGDHPYCANKELCACGCNRRTVE